MLFFLLAGVALGAPVVEERVEYAGSRFRVVRATPERVQVVWKDPHGVPYRTFDRVRDAFAKNGKTVGFLMNAGIFESGGIPCGLHVENRKTLHELNLADAPGNFFLKPNGVFWIEGVGNKRQAFITPSESFLKHNEALRFMSARWLECAVQSGPLLLIDGRRHPAFKEGSPNKLHRNGVGVDDQGHVVFAITDTGQVVNLWDFAGLFLKLRCKDALFLDGDISQSVVYPDKTVQSNQFAAMFVIAE